MSAVLAAGTTAGMSSSYLSLISHSFVAKHKKAEELEEFIIAAERANGEKVESFGGMSRSSKLIRRFISRWFHVSHLSMDEIAESVATAEERIGDSVAILKPFFAMIQFGLDVHDLAHKKFQYSQLAKLMISTFVVAGSSLVVGATMAGCEVLLRVLYGFQLFLAVGLTVRSMIALHQARQEKIQNKKALAKNTTELATLAKKLNSVTTLERLLTSHRTNLNYLNSLATPLSIPDQAWRDELTQKIAQLERTIPTYQNDPTYRQAKLDFAQKLQLRLELEDQRDEIKKEYHHAMVDVWIGLNNVLASAVGVFFMVSAALGISGISIAGSVGDMIYTAKQRKQRRIAMDGEDENASERDKLNSRTQYYVERLNRSFDAESPKDKSWWHRLISLGSRRAVVKESDATEIKSALLLMNYADTETVKKERTQAEVRIALDVSGGETDLDKKLTHLGRTSQSLRANEEMGLVRPKPFDQDNSLRL